MASGLAIPGRSHWGHDAHIKPRSLRLIILLDSNTLRQSPYFVTHQIFRFTDITEKSWKRAPYYIRSHRKGHHIIKLEVILSVKECQIHEIKKRIKKYKMSSGLLIYQFLMKVYYFDRDSSARLTINARTIDRMGHWGMYTGYQYSISGRMNTQILSEMESLKSWHGTWLRCHWQRLKMPPGRAICRYPPRF